MKHEEGSFEGFEKTKIYYQVWKPENESIGTVIICHGFGEHSGRHINLATGLVNSGFTVYALDHRGHGKSEGRINYVNKFSDYFKDLEIFANLVQNTETTPLHLFGHSMGSIIALNYIGEYKPEANFKTLVLTGTGTAPGPAIGKVVQTISKVLGKIAPKMNVASGLKPEFVSYDEKVVEAYINDPLVHIKKISARLGAEFLKYTLKAKDSAKNVKLPVFIGIGSEDEAFHPKSREILFNSFPNNDKELKIYENMRHEICNEIEKQIPINDIVNWIKSHN